MNPNKDVLAQVDKLEKTIVEYCMELIRIPSVNPPGERYGECANFILSVLKDIKIEAKTITTPKDEVAKSYEVLSDLPRINILGSYGDGDTKGGLHLSGHYDVVPAGKRWTRDPYDPTIEEGKLYGLGSTDQKGGIATILGVLKVLRNLGITLKKNLTFSFTPDEETGGFGGLGYLARNGFINGDYGIITEPSQPDLVKIGHRGVLWLRLVTIGRTGHGAMPSTGINAFEKMLDIATELKKLHGRISKRQTAYPMEFEAVRHPSLTMTVIRAGVKVNVVPDECEILIDRRVLPEEKLADAMAEVQDILDQLLKKDNELKVFVEPIHRVEPCAISEEALISQTVAKNHNYIYNKKPRFILSPGTNDSRFLINDASIPTLTYGPGILKLAHTPDEYLFVEDLVRNTKVLLLTTLDLLGYL